VFGVSEPPGTAAAASAGIAGGPFSVVSAEF
jgi:hypothetical protein